MASRPPDSTLPDDGMTALWARAKRVMESSRITTSRLCSTSRLAFSMTMSATWTWRCGGSSKVEEMTSPLTERCMSVTSSGRSSMSSTMRYTSGWFLAMALARFWSSTVLPVRGAATIRPRWPLPIGQSRSIDPGGQVVGVVLEPEPLHRVERRQVVEEGLVARLLGRLEVDRLDLEQGEVALGVLGRPHLAGDGVAGAQVEAPDLGRRDVDVVGARQVVVVGRAQEAEAVGQHLEHALGEDEPVPLRLPLQDLEDQLLLAEAAARPGRPGPWRRCSDRRWSCP